MATQIRIKKADGGHEVLVLVEHPMHTGMQKKDGKTIPAHWIKKMSFALNGKEMAVGKDKKIVFAAKGGCTKCHKKA